MPTLAIFESKLKKKSAFHLQICNCQMKGGSRAVLGMAGGVRLKNLANLTTGSSGMRGIFQETRK
jgi:hypothetical protein